LEYTKRMEIWNYTKNAKVETIYPITIWGTFVSDINSWREKLNNARNESAKLTEEIINIKKELSEAFQNEPHSEHVKHLKEKYRRIKRLWKRASTYVVQYRYFLNCEQRAFEQFKIYYPKSLMQEDLIKNHHYKKPRR